MFWLREIYIQSNVGG